MPLKEPTPRDRFWIPGRERGLGREENWDRVMSLIGAERIDALLRQPTFRNADYVWHTEKLIIELKNLEVDLAEQPGFADKINAAVSRAADREEQDKAVGSIVRSYLKDIISSANKQIKETKRELCLCSYTGIVLVVNSGFSTLSFAAASNCFRNIIRSKSQFRSVGGLIYIEDFEKPEHLDSLDQIGLFGTGKMSIYTEASMLMVLKAWQLYLTKPWLRAAHPESYAIEFEAQRDPSRHWRPSDIHAMVLERITDST